MGTCQVLGIVGQGTILIDYFLPDTDSMGPQETAELSSPSQELNPMVRKGPKGAPVVPHLTPTAAGTAGA